MDKKILHHRSVNKLVLVLAFVVFFSCIALGKIGGTVPDFRGSDFAKMTQLRLSSHEAKGDVFLGSNDLMVAVFFGADGKITKQRMKWRNNRVPEGTIATKLILSFFMEATGAQESDRKTLLDKMLEAQLMGTSVQFRGFTLLYGELDVNGHKDLLLEVSR